MADILILGKDDKTCFEVEAAAKRHEFRVKLTFEINAAVEWLQLKPFDAVLVDVTINAEEQQKLADILWSKNPQAHLIIFDLRGSQGSLGNQARLFGADYVYGAKGVAHLERLFAKIQTAKPLAKNDFKVLVVEDLDSPRDIICFYLEGLGYSKVKGVNSAKAALQELREADYSCVLTDVKMPGMNGRELIDILRAEQRFVNMPVIVLTAIGTLENLIECMKAGASGFLVKPPKKEDILRELSRAQRIFSGRENARLVQADEAEQFKEALQQRGIT